MADAATDFLLNSLKDLAVKHGNLIKNAKGDVESLQKDLGVFKAFLRDTAHIRKKDDRTRVMVKEIHNVVYELEDIMDVFVTKTIETRHTTRFFKIFEKAANLHDIGQKVAMIKGNVESLRRDINIVTVNADTDEKPEARPPRKEDVVGFKDVTDNLIEHLTKLEPDHLDVISMIGMFGLGKTTLAWKIFSDPEVVYKFQTRIWLNISSKFDDKAIFLDILKELTTLDDEIRAKNADELASLVSDYLRTGSFLIVMDDVWSADDWRRLRVALPGNNAKGKVLITSRMKEVGNAASISGYVCQLRFFELKESLELLQLQALGNRECPTELIEVAKEIAENCDGLPLIVVVVGGILAASCSANSDIDAMVNTWKNMSTDMSTSMISDKGERIKKLISLSYEKLPYHLRACFLYFGLFPEDHEIPASKLIRMWIAEGFIEEKPNYSLEETGEAYLENLISRNLVKGVKFRPDGHVKMCQIHDALHEFCRDEANDENFFQEIRYNSDGKCVTSDLNTYRRLSVHSRCLDFIQPKPFGPRVRSFVCFPKDKYVVSAEDSTKIIGAFKLLRVLDVLSFKFTIIDSDLYKLIHMRYIALSSELKTLHARFSNLSNVQTLTVDTTSRTLKVDAHIWKMKHLRHFKTNASSTLPKPKKSDKPSADLQTLGLIAVESCTEELAEQAPNLKKLGIRGKLAMLFNEKSGNLDNLKRMEKLGKLKLQHDPYPIPLSEGRLGFLPEPNRFPSALTSLTLCGTYLSWEHMSTLRLLNKLKVLKLKDQAFMGRSWKEEDGGFLCLKFLLIDNTNLVSWSASSHSYPKLKSLVLKNCESLRGIPIELAAIPSFRALELYTCMLAVESAKDIRLAKMKKVADTSAFGLSIYPPVD